MSTDLRIKLSNAGIAAFLKSDDVAYFCYGFAQKIASEAGEGFEIVRYNGRDRVSVVVRTATPEAREAEAKNRVLTRAMLSARR